VTDLDNILNVTLFYIHTYHRVFREEVAETSQISETPIFYQNDFAMGNTANVTGRILHGGGGILVNYFNNV
jgi:hypothetical protein